MPRFEDIFEVICERNQSPFQVLSKYREDPDVLVSFSNILEPRVMKEPEPLPYGDKRRSGRKKEFDKKTKRLGINPRSEFDTPIGIYGFPLKVYWDDWLSQGRAHFAIERPIIWVYKPRRPERCARSSTYNEQDLERDFQTLREMFPDPKYDPDKILSDTSPEYKRTSFQKFWTVTRNLALMFNRIQAFPDDDGKLKDGKTTAPVMWTRILMRFYDGMIDDLGESTIHVNEPWQGVIWVNSLITELDHIDRRKIEKSKRLQSTYVDWGHQDSGDIVQKNNTLRTYLFDRFSKGDEHKIRPHVIEAIKDSKTFRLIMMAYVGNPDLMSELPHVELDRSDKSKLIDIFLSKEPEINDKFINNSAFNLIVDNFSRHMEYVLDHTDISSLNDANLSSILQKLAYNLNASTLKHLEEILRIPSTRPSAAINTMGSMVRLMEKLPDEYIKAKLHKFVSFLAFGIGNNNYISEENRTIGQLLRLLPMMKDNDEHIFDIMPILWNTNVYRQSKEIFLNSVLSLYGDNSDLTSFIKEVSIDNKKITPQSSQDDLDGIWYKYFGTTLYKDEYSQSDVMDKSQKLKAIRGKNNIFFKVGSLVKSRDGKIGNIRDVLRAKRIDPLYAVTWEDGDISPIRQSELTAHVENVDTPFRIYDKVEDQDGNIYEYIKDSSDTPGHVTVYDTTTHKYKSINPNDLIKYDFNNPLKGITFKVGDYIKITKGLSEGKTGTVIAVDNGYREVMIKLDQGGERRYEFDYVEKTEKGDSVQNKTMPSENTQWEPIDDIDDDVKDGDYVKCVAEGNGAYLTLGKIYIVDHTYISGGDQYLKIVMDNGELGGFYTFRFHKVKQETTDTTDISKLTPLESIKDVEAGDEVICIDNEDFENVLTKGKTYTVGSINYLCGGMRIANNLDNMGEYHYSRFAYHW